MKLVGTMDIKKIQKKRTNKTEFISARIKPINKKWFRKNKIDLDALVEELRLGRY